jgi:hypothetical protein
MLSFNAAFVPNKTRRLWSRGFRACDKKRHLFGPLPQTSARDIDSVGYL